MGTILAVTVTEELNGDVTLFESREYALGFASGFESGGGSYGAGHCAVYFEGNLSELSADDAKEAARMFKKYRKLAKLPLFGG